MKRLVVNLRMFQDDATGEYGLTHDETYDDSFSPFNAFWNGIGIFHDVFEHNFELTHKYFRGDNGLNVGGEMAAMGAMWYYIDVLGIAHVRRLNPYSAWSDGDSMRFTTESEIQEAICSGYCNFGSTLECGVPYQKPTGNGELEYQIEQLYKNVKGFYPRDIEDFEEKQRCWDYKKSVILGKIQRLHRWGYYMAKRLVPDNWANQKTLSDFIQFWNDYTKNNPAEDVYNMGVTGFKFVITKVKGEIKWSAYYRGGVLDGKKVQDIYPEELYYEEGAKLYSY